MQVRNAAADALYTELPEEVLLMQDWSRAAKDLKEVVVGLTDRIEDSRHDLDTRCI